MCKNRHDWKVFMNEFLKGGKYAEDLAVVFKHVNRNIRSVRFIPKSTGCMFLCVCCILTYGILIHIFIILGSGVMGSDQQFCLRWHNYQSSLLASLPQLLDGDDLTDVTLSAGGRNLRAHRVVLSACSQYFKELFKVCKELRCS